MKKHSLINLMITILFSFCLMIPIPSFAESIPNNEIQQVENNDNRSANGLDLEPVDAEDVFGPGFTAKDESGYADEINLVGVSIMKFIVSTCVYLFAIFFTIIFIVDCVCIPFPAINKFFAEVVPIQLFSNEIVPITGISYSKGGKEGGSAPPPSSDGNNKDATLANKYITYAKNRALTLVFTGLIMVMTYSGLMQTLLNLAINAIVGLITG